MARKSQVKHVCRKRGKIKQKAATKNKVATSGAFSPFCLLVCCEPRAVEAMSEAKQHDTMEPTITPEMQEEERKMEQQAEQEQEQLREQAGFGF